MKVALWYLPNKWIQSQYDDSEIKRVVFKGIDDNKSYYLNLNTKFQNVVNKWEPNLKEGIVLDVQVQSAHPKNINMFEPYQIIKGVKDGTKA